MPLRSSVWKSCWSSSGWSCDLRCPSISCWPHWPSPFPAEFLSEWLTLNCSKNQRSASAFRLGEGFNFFVASSFTCSLTIWRGQLGELQQVFNLFARGSSPMLRQRSIHILYYCHLSFWVHVYMYVWIDLCVCVTCTYAQFIIHGIYIYIYIHGNCIKICGLLSIRTGILDYLRELFPWPAPPFKHTESNSFKHTATTFKYTNWYFILPLGPRGLTRLPLI